MKKLLEFLKKVYAYLKTGLSAVGKFLKYAYASQITICGLAVFLYLFVSRFLGIVFFIWGALLAFNEYKQNQPEDA